MKITREEMKKGFNVTRTDYVLIIIVDSIFDHFEAEKKFMQDEYINGINARQAETEQLKVELQEALQTKSKSCENCKYYKSVEIFDNYAYNFTCTHEEVSKFVSCQPKDFYCSKHQPK